MKKLMLLILALATPHSIQASDPENSQRSFPPTVNYLSSEDEHEDFLMDALYTARNRIVISVYKLSHERFFGEEVGIIADMIEAAKRGIDFYIYYREAPVFSTGNYDTLISCCKKFEQIATHAKCLMIDDRIVAIGSYPWLGFNTDYDESFNASLVFSGRYAPGINQDVWEAIHFYQNLADGNNRGINKFLNNRDAFSTASYRYATDQFFYTLRTSEAHHQMLTEVLENIAQRHIILLSPFIRLQKLQETLSNTQLQNLQQRDIQILLVTLPSPAKNHNEKSSIFQHLDSLVSGYPNTFFYEIQENIHAKTLIADDFICEGSFNWLSAAPTVEEDYNNFEMSMALRGEIAANFIEKFYDTHLGRTLRDAEENPDVSGQDNYQIEKNEWVHSSRWKISQKGNVYIEHNGERFVILGPYSNGFCLRINDDYIRDENGKQFFFASIEEAKGAIVDILLGNN
jgi:hypothetical protein